MTAQEQANIRAILKKAQPHIAKAKREASPEQAIYIANREAQVESYFRKQGVERPPFDDPPEYHESFA